VSQRGYETNDSGQARRRWIGRRRLCPERQRHYAARLQDGAPEGRKPIAQGNALGIRPPPYQALKGRPSQSPGHRPGFLLVHGWCVAFPRAGALGFCWFTGGASHFPGHRPGLSACAPPGLHPDRIRPQPHHTGIGVPAVLHKPWRGPGGDHDRRCTGRSRPAPRGAVPCTGC
jgi:hypothetical protein